MNETVFVCSAIKNNELLSRQVIAKSNEEAELNFFNELTTQNKNIIFSINLCKKLILIFLYQILS